MMMISRCFTLLTTLQVINQMIKNKSINKYSMLLSKPALVLCLLVLAIQIVYPSEVGYQVSNVTGYTVLRKYNKSTLYQVESPGVTDGRPLKLCELIGTPYEVGFAHAKLLLNEILFTYNTFMNGEIPKKWQLKLLEFFLDWQYDSYVSKQIPNILKDEIRGLKAGGISEGVNNLHLMVQRTLVVSSYPGGILNDIEFALLNEFKMYIRNHKIFRAENTIAVQQGGDSEQDLQQVIQKLQSSLPEFLQFANKFLQKKKIQCSFFAVWGNRTETGELFSMRNLDWEANTGINKNKIVFVYKIERTIPHSTLGFPGLIGALTGMSAAGITVHEAGLDSKRETELGFQWTLRLRYIMMFAKNVKQAQFIWKNTNNTLGMNHMIASASDVQSGHPALVVETMAGYTAYFRDYDPRENQTTFVDPTTKKPYVAGHSMPEAVFRTNHGYDPKIRRHLYKKDDKKSSDSMVRYFLLKDGFNWYKDNNIKMNTQHALNLTAILGDKGGSTEASFKKCPSDNRGINVISVMFQPGQLKQWVGFEYGFGKQYKPGCCGVYVQMDMKRWFGETEQ